ncbi:hypothetical protein ONZ45_g8085 [Pleurotus djamor]|nr:hypothetical protein ONZ45_g8085 [Pleurotus djamor]
MIKADEVSTPGEENEKKFTVDVETVRENSQEDGVTAVYEAKSRLINKHMQNEVGFGRYQIQLFLLTGLGWAADNIWLQGVAIILPQIQHELRPTRVEYATLALYVGLILGATTWGILADLIGRRLSFNITLFIAGVFGVAAGSANSFTALASLIACMGFGVGGNLPVDVVIDPAFGVATSLVSQGFLIVQKRITWDGDIRSTPWGGVTLVMWVLRFLVFDLQESSKFMIAKGRDEEAVEILRHIARKNGRTITLTADALRRAAGESTSETNTHPTNYDLIKQSISQFSLSHVTPLFSTKRLATNTAITILLWGLIGLAYPLFNGFITLYLTTQVPNSDTSVSRTYRDYSIISIMGIPGSIIACLVVDYTRKSQSTFTLGGRKLTMAISTALTGVFLFLFTTSKSQAAVLGLSCASGVTQNAMYGVLYAYTPEVFPAPHRGTGDALCSAFNRVTGILAPVIKIATTNPDGSATTSVANGPIFVSATLFIISSVLMLLLPIETAGKAAL